MMNFKERVKMHLGQYKKDVMQIAQPGEYIRSGKVHLHDHILPVAYKHHNILPLYRTSFWHSADNEKLHRDFHYLNSSQAMCFNFFYPLIAEQQLNILLDILSLSHEPYEEILFEKSSLVDRTQFDFYMKLKSGINLYFEIKYTEDGFKTKKSGDYKSHFHKYELLLTNHPAIHHAYQACEPFYAHFQMMRNLLHIDDQSYVIFIYPEGNKRVQREAQLARTTIVNKAWQAHVMLITWEELLAKVRTYPLPLHLQRHYEQFSEKYMIR